MLLKVNIIKIYGEDVKKIAEFVEIEKEIEVLREKLNRELDNIDRSKATSDNILELSRRIDMAVVEYQKMLNKE